ncbi:hypothetical protein [Dysgonomonas macrotermitis]|uniref:Lipoprotein n=1 Tax=Dysgonomonas macrotermitis TaxID=1346286 RepID=A0A1M4ZRV5_9BACT|nr:hypothetical protein [Dysgonomonas macrotermitis]SHF20793.1 hypothetical protein SAMN05444362_104171 [Dysgonomonas macrotermitis]
MNIVSLKNTVTGCLVCLSGLCSFAQIGINTEVPQALLHIDPLGNNNASGAPTDSQALDDVVITSAGNMGIGTISPKRKLHIVTGGTETSPQVGLRLEDGDQGLNKVLISDVNGIGTWKNAPTPSALVAYRNPSAPGIATNVGAFYNTGSYIDLPPGKWYVTVNTLLVGTSGLPAATTIQDKQFCHASFTESSSMGTALAAANISADVKDAKQIAKLITKRTYNVLVGSFIIINTTTATKRYYYMFGALVQISTSQGNGTFTNVAGTANAENTMVGIQFQ